MESQRPLGLLIRRPFIRSIEADRRLEAFLVTAVASILAIRFTLEMTGYPQLGGGGLHIAHVLLGGFFMMASIVILLAYLDEYSRDLAAVIGGFGFGAFIDELGKFITCDNDYFFQPTIALIYITFVLLYLGFQAINGKRDLTPEERAINVLEIAKSAILNDMDIQDRHRALDLLQDGDPPHPLAPALKEMLDATLAVPAQSPGTYKRLKETARRIYLGLVRKRWFTTAVVAAFVLVSLLSLLDTLVLVTIKMLESMLEMELVSLTTTEWLSTASLALAALMVLRGVLIIHKDRLQAYRRFKRAVLVQIFLVQVFSFYADQLYAIFGLSTNILTLAVLRYMIRQEEEIEEQAISKAGRIAK